MVTTDHRFCHHYGYEGMNGHPANCSGREGRQRKMANPASAAGGEKLPKKMPRYLKYFLGMGLIIFLAPLTGMILYNLFRPVSAPIHLPLPAPRSLPKVMNPEGPTGSSPTTATQANSVGVLIPESELKNAQSIVEIRELNQRYIKLMIDYHNYLERAAGLNFEDAQNAISKLVDNCIAINVLIYHISQKDKSENFSKWARQIPFSEILRDLEIDNDLRHAQWLKAAQYYRNYGNWDNEVYYLRKLGAPGQAMITERTVSRFTKEDYYLPR
jgi:hypothetical protein